MCGRRGARGQGAQRPAALARNTGTASATSRHVLSRASSARAARAASAWTVTPTTARVCIYVELNYGLCLKVLRGEIT